MHYIVEHLKFTDEGYHEWKFVSNHYWYLGALWSYLSLGGTNRILKLNKIRW